MRTTIFKGRTVKYKGEVHEAVLPGLDGEFAVLDFHRPFLYRLRKGLIKVREAADGPDTERVSIRDGLAQFKGNELLIFAE